MLVESRIIDLRHLVIDDNFVISMRMEVDCLLCKGTNLSIILASSQM